MVGNCSKKLSSEYQRRQAAVDGRDPPQVVVVDVPKYDGFHILLGKLSGIHNVKIFHFQGGEEAFHPGVVIAAAGAAHALNKLAASESLTE